MIGDMVLILDADHHELDPSNRWNGPGTISPVVIGNNVWIGANSIVLDGVTLGNNVIVAAGAVVSKDFGDNCIIGGVPARVIRQSEKILDVDWWEYEVEVLEKAVRNSASSDFDEYNHNFRKYFYENESK